MTITRLIHCLLVIGSTVAGASAATMDVQVGWDGAFRTNRWSPVFVTVSDLKPRNAIIELYVPHDTVQSMTIRQLVPVTPTPQTYAIYAPLTGRIDEISVTLREPGRLRSLAKWVNDPSYGLGGSVTPIESVHQLVGITGRNSTQRLIEGQFDRQSVVVKSFSANRLPDHARGFESFNALLLDQPDLTRIPLEKQQAIVDWVRGGGTVVCWLGEDQQPPISPILRQLPATVGENTNVTVSPEALRAAGLPTRFGNMKGRILTPTDDAKPIKLFGGEVQAYKRTLGLGSVVLVPFDCSTLLIDGPDKAREFWRPLLDGAVDLTKRDDNNPVNYYAYNDPAQQRRAHAASAVMNLLGNVPGAGSFGFTWVALVMIGLMVVVGPVDWIVLKRLGRQPWTWITTSGWIALVTLGALYLGHTMKSGELHYHTLRLLDQAGGEIIAAIDTAAIYSPRTAEYDMKADSESWWEPLSADQYYYRSGRKLDIDFHQTYKGNTPEKMRINVWNLRFMSGETTVSAPPLIEAELRQEARAARSNFVVGTIKNVSSLPLKDLLIRTPDGFCLLDKATIAPGQSLAIDQRLQKTPPPTTQYGRFGSYNDVNAVGIEQYFRLATERTSRIDRRMQTSKDVVIVYAMNDDVPAPGGLNPAPNIEKHQQMVRAVFPLRKEQE
jgi:hypothetical protein